MNKPTRLVPAFTLALAAVVLLAGPGMAGSKKYDLAYIWASNIESVLDYKDELAGILGDKVGKRLKVVGRGKLYGVIYDIDASAKTAARQAARQADVLRKAGFEEARAIEDRGYHGLYNVSYGLGPNLAALKTLYTKLYGYLGKEVGKNLFIEKKPLGKYVLVYRRRGDRKSTLAVARRHARLLRSKKIRTTITPENSNEVVYGESSLIDASGGRDKAVKAAKAKVPDKPAAAVCAITKQPIAPAAAKAVKKVRKTAAVTAVDTAFERDIERFIKKLRRKGHIRGDEKTSWMVYDLKNDTSLVDINGNVPFQAASMIKPFVALAFFHKVKHGRLRYGPKSRRMMEAMIQRSSNTATNWIMRQAGGPARCERILRRHYSSIFKNTVIREYIPRSGRTYRNSALPADYIRFLRALWKNKLPYGREIRRVMALPGRDRIYSGTAIPQGTLVYNKTGSTAHLCGDMGILAPKTPRGRRYPYAIVGIIERRSRPSNYGRWMLSRSNVIRNVSTLVYKEIKKQHRLL